MLARDPDGYARLCRTISAAQLAGRRRGAPSTTSTRSSPTRPGTWLVLTGCRKGAVPAALRPRRARRGGRARAAAAGRRGSGADNVVVELWDHGDPLDSDAQRRPRRARRRRRAADGRHQQRPLRHAGAAPAGHRARRGAGPAQPRRDRRLAAAPRAPRTCARVRRWPRRFARYPGRGGAGGRARRRAAPSTSRSSRPTCRRSATPPGHTEMTLAARAHPARRRCERYGHATPTYPEAVRHRSTTSWRSSSSSASPATSSSCATSSSSAARRTSSARAGARRPTRAVCYALGHHQGRRGVARPAVRAVPLARARRPARHRPRHRVRPPRGGDPVRLRALRPRTTPPRSPTSSPTGPGRRCATWPRRSGYSPGQQDAWTQADRRVGHASTPPPTQADARHPRSRCSTLAAAGRGLPRATSASTPAAW